MENDAKRSTVFFMPEQCFSVSGYESKATFKTKTNNQLRIDTFYEIKHQSMIAKSFKQNRYGYFLSEGAFKPRERGWDKTSTRLSLNPIHLLTKSKGTELVHQVHLFYSYTDCF